MIRAEIDWTAERIEQEIRATFPEDPITAVAIAKAESGLNANAYNPESHINCVGSIGVMQIACVHDDDPKRLYEVQYNLMRAREIYDNSGWLPWGGFTSGSYMKYMIE